MPRIGEFSREDYNQVLLRGVCEECGEGYDPKDPWRVHHIIWLDWGKDNGIPLTILQSIGNARLYHNSCHNHIHTEYDTPPQRDIDFVLSQFAIQMKLW